MSDPAKDKPEPKKRGRKKGTPKTGGRKKGTRNRNSGTVLTSLDKASVPLIEFLVADIQCLEPHERVERWFRLMAYCYPKLKSIETFTHMPPTGGDAPEQKTATPAAAGEAVRVFQSRDERMRLIRGQEQGKPEASG